MGEPPEKFRWFLSVSGTDTTWTKGKKGSSMGEPLEKSWLLPSVSGTDTPSTKEKLKKRP